MYELGVPALKEVRSSAAFFVHDDGEVDASSANGCLPEPRRFPKDEALSPGDVPIDDARRRVGCRRATRWASRGCTTWRARAHEDSRRRLDRERAKLSSYFDYREQAARRSLASSQASPGELEASDQTRNVARSSLSGRRTSLATNG